MRYPNLRQEKKLGKKGLKRVVCLDEAGRGSLAGPVVAAAVMIRNPKFQISNPKQNLNLKLKFSKQFGIWKIGKLEFVSDFKFRVSDLKIKDSKKLSPKQREEFFKLFLKNPQIKWAIAKVSEKIIDKINILEATKLAMKKAIENLEKKYSHGRIRISRARAERGRGLRYSCADFLILDGNFKIDLKIPQKSIIKADEKILGCKIASILAKVSRDRIMEKYDKRFPQYGFSKHKGYGTKYHLKMLKKYGPCKIHRRSFKPIANLKNLKTTLLKN